MLDINVIREHAERVRYAITTKKKSLDLDLFFSLDDRRKELQQVIDQKRFDQKQA